MNLTTKFCDNYFPPIFIFCIKWKDGSYENRVYYLCNEPDSPYEKEYFGVWNVKYKKLDPNYYCDGQRNTDGCH